MPYESLWMYPVFLATGLVAGWVDSIAGGGGLITIPVLLASGLPPRMVLGTNKFQASFGSFTAAAYYTSRGIVPLADAWLGIAMTLVGAVAGTYAVQQINPDLLGWIIPFLLLAIALYMLFSPSSGLREGPPRMKRSGFYALFGLGLGFYDGFFGPGVGSFWAVAFVSVMGFSLVTATGYTKVMNFTSNLVSFLVFLAGGHVFFGAALSMAAGQILGARVGSKLVIRRGSAVIRPILIGVVLLTTLKLIYDRLAGGM